MALFSTAIFPNTGSLLFYQKHRDILREEAAGQLPAKIRELEQKIDRVKPKMQPHGLIAAIVAGVIGGLWVVSNLVKYFPGALSEGGTFQFQTFLGQFFPFCICSIPLFLMIWVGFLAIGRFQSGSERAILRKYKTELKDVEKNLETRKQQIEQEIAQTDRELESLKLRHRAEIRKLDGRLTYLHAAVEELKQQLPTPPSNEIVSKWLEEDLKRLQQESIRDTGIGTKLERDITFYDPEGNEFHVDNPIAFVTPGELQDPDRIPPPYRPPQFDILERLSEAALSETKSEIPFLSAFINSSQLTHRLQPKPTPNRARHLLAKRRATTNQGYGILFGVYYIEYLVVAEDMMTGSSP